MPQRQAEHASLARTVESETKRQREAVKQLESSCVALRDEAGSAKSALGRQGERLKSIEGDVMTLKRESSDGNAQQRALKGQIKEVGDALTAHKKEVRRVNDQTEMRYEAYDEACAVFAQALKLANPVAAALSSAAAALWPPSQAPGLGWCRAVEEAPGLGWCTAADSKPHPAGWSRRSNSTAATATVPSLPDSVGWSRLLWAPRTCADRSRRSRSRRRSSQIRSRAHRRRLRAAEARREKSGRGLRRRGEERRREWARQTRSGRAGRAQSLSAA